MAPNPSLQAVTEEVFRQKETRRRELAALPFEEKIAILVRLQQLASAVSKETRGHCRKPWLVEQ
jgi:hypothetical protein